MNSIKTLMALVALAFSAVATAEATAPVSLEFLAGEWILEDAGGQQVGVSRIEVQASGAMRFEQRIIGARAPQPLGFANSERTGGWVQLFLNPESRLREFATQSSAGERPLVFGGDVTLRDGSAARFRLTISRIEEQGSRRVLELSRDQGAAGVPRWITPAGAGTKTGTI